MVCSCWRKEMVLPLLLFLLPASRGLRLASFFQDGMVLQRAPQPARLYGFDSQMDGFAEAVVSCTLAGAALPVQRTRSRIQAGDTGIQGAWQVELAPQEAGTLCDITVVAGEEEVGLQGVLFGDVWLCSGQSNMVFKMAQIFNSTEEIEASATYTDIRYTVLNLGTSDVEETDIVPKVPWTDPANSVSLGQMSAVCFLFARALQDGLAAGGERVPLGLIASAWGGTKVEAWSPPAALASCGVPDHVVPDKPQHTNSALWNAMIAPLRQLALTGFLWYQGEANGNQNRDLYNCTFPALIDSWREEFDTLEAPFGFVQLSTIQYGNTGLSYPQLRNHQTADYGTVPNPRMPGTFMAVAVDTYDEENGIHPRYKQVVGERLAVAGLAVAYGAQDLPSQGPLVLEIATLGNGDYLLTYDQPFTFDDTELNGFYFCCGQPGVCRDALSANSWPAFEPEGVTAEPGARSLRLAARTCAVDGEMVSLAYLWRQTPIQEPVWGAPLYAADSYRLPAPPAIWTDIA